MNKTILRLAWILIGVGTVISLYFAYSTYSDGFTFRGDAKIDFPITGQFGDFVGGVVGTVFALAGTLLIYLSFKEQTSQNVKEGFENTFFELVSIHRDNVNQLTYTKFDNGELRTSETRKVFRLIFSEFLECYREVRKFSNSKNPDDYILPKYKVKLQEMCRLPQKQYVLKVDKLINFKNVKHEKESIHPPRLPIMNRHSFGSRFTG